MLSSLFSSLSLALLRREKNQRCKLKINKVHLCPACLLTLSQTRFLHWPSPTSSASPFPRWSPGRRPPAGPPQAAVSGLQGFWWVSCYRGCPADPRRWRREAKTETRERWCWRKTGAARRCCCWWGEEKWWWGSCNRSASLLDGFSCFCRSAAEGS